MYFSVRRNKTAKSQDGQSLAIKISLFLGIIVWQ